MTLKQAQLIYRLAYMEQKLAQEADRVKAGGRR